MPGPSTDLYWNKSQVTVAARNRRYVSSNVPQLLAAPGENSNARAVRS